MPKARILSTVRNKWEIWCVIIPGFVNSLNIFVTEINWGKQYNAQASHSAVDHFLKVVFPLFEANRGDWIQTEMPPHLSSGRVICWYGLSVSSPTTVVLTCKATQSLGLHISFAFFTIFFSLFFAQTFHICTQSLCSAIAWDWAFIHELLIPPPAKTGRTGNQ